MRPAEVGELIEEEHIALPHPSLAELRELSLALPLHVMPVRQTGRIVALAVCCLQAVRVHGV